MHQINTMPELNGQCRDSPLKHGQHKWYQYKTQKE